MKTWSSDSTYYRKIGRLKCSILSGWRFAHNLKVNQNKIKSDCHVPFYIWTIGIVIVYMYATFRNCEPDIWPSTFKFMQKEIVANFFVVSNIIQKMQLYCIHWTMNNVNMNKQLILLPIEKRWNAFAEKEPIVHFLQTVCTTNVLLLTGGIHFQRNGLHLLCVFIWVWTE